MEYILILLFFASSKFLLKKLADTSKSRILIPPEKHGNQTWICEPTMSN